MSKIRDKILNNCNKEQLIFIIKSYEKSLYNICEICVDESKSNIDNKEAIKEIRKELNVLNEIDYLDMQNKLALLMGEITTEEYRRRLGL